MAGHPSIATCHYGIGPKPINRRKLLTGSGLVAGAAVFPTPAISPGKRELKLVTRWPKGFPGLGGRILRQQLPVPSSS